LIIYIWTRSKY